MHIFGWASPNVTKYILVNDGYIRDAANKLQPDSLLLAFGDHGATREATHGGGTIEELESALFAYSKKNFTFRKFLYPNLLSSKEQYLLNILKDAVNMSFLIRNSFQQIDLVPTTASQFNVPIPFSNLGIVIPEFMHYVNCTVAECIYELYMDHIINYLQVINYVKIFAEPNKEMQEQYVHINETYNSIKDKINSLIHSGHDIVRMEKAFISSNSDSMTEDHLKRYKKTIKALFEIMQLIREELLFNSQVFKNEWLTLNMVYMYSNLILRILTTLLLACSILILYMEMSSNLQILSSTILANGFTALILFILFIFILFYAYWSDSALVVIYSAVLLSLAICIHTFYKYDKIIKEIIANKKVSVLPIVESIFLICVQVWGYTQSAYSIKHYGNNTLSNI